MRKRLHDCKNTASFTHQALVKGPLWMGADFDLVIRDGHIVTPKGVIEGDLAITGGRIAEIACAYRTDVRHGAYECRHL